MKPLTAVSTCMATIAMLAAPAAGSTILKVDFQKLIRIEI